MAINWPVTRDDITVFRRADGTLYIRVGDDKNNFMSSVSRDGPVESGIQNLTELICKKVLGITEHDIRMVTLDYIMKENS